MGCCHSKDSAEIFTSIEDGVRVVRVPIHRPLKTAAGDTIKSNKPTGLGINIRTTNGVSGCTIVEVRPGSTAAEAGLKPGDVITEIDGRSVLNSPHSTVMDLLRSPHESVTLGLIASGKRASDPTTLMTNEITGMMDAETASKVPVASIRHTSSIARKPTKRKEPKSKVVKQESASDLYRAETSGWLVRKQGYLLKSSKGSGYYKSVKRRFFVLKIQPLVLNAELEYYENGTLRGSMSLAGALVKPGLGATFTIHTDDRMWALATEDNDFQACLSWMQAIKDAAKRESPMKPKKTARRSDADDLKDSARSAVKKGLQLDNVYGGEEIDVDDGLILNAVDDDQEPVDRNKSYTSAIPDNQSNDDKPENYVEVNNQAEDDTDTHSTATSQDASANQERAEQQHQQEAMEIHHAVDEKVKKGSIISAEGDVDNIRVPSTGQVDNDLQGLTGKQDIMNMIDSIKAKMSQVQNCDLYDRAMSGHVQLSDEKQDACFTIMQFNMLARGLSSGPNQKPLYPENTTKESSYGGFGEVPYPEVCLDWDFRKFRLLEEMIRNDPDIITVQEVDHYNDFFKPALEEFGYSSIWAPKKGSPSLDFGYYSDGVGIFVKDDIFSTEQQIIKYFSNGEGLSGRPFVSVICKHRKTNRKLVVITTHLKAKSNEKAESIRDEHAKQLLSFMEDVISEKVPDALVFAADMNADPFDVVDKKGNTVEAWCVPTLANSKLGLSSAYKLPTSASDKFYTTWKKRGNDEVKHMIDYIWYTEKSLACVKTLDPVNASTMEETRLPGFRYPSDHLSQVATMRFQTREATTKPEEAESTTVRMRTTSVPMRPRALSQRYPSEDELIEAVLNERRMSVASTIGSHRSAELEVHIRPGTPDPNATICLSEDHEKMLLERCKVLIMEAKKSAPELLEQQSQHKFFIASHDYVAVDSEDEFSFSKKDEMLVHREDADGWWLATRIADGMLGYVPATFIIGLPEYRAAQSGQPSVLAKLPKMNYVLG